MKRSYFLKQTRKESQRLIYRNPRPTRNGRSLGFPSQRSKVSRFAVMEGSKNSGTILGSLASSQRRQLRSIVSNPVSGMPSCSASHICPGIDSSNHCSRSLASYALTCFHEPSFSLALAHSVLPGQLHGVTKTNVQSARSTVESEST